MTMSNWRPIKGYEKSYEINPNGQVLSHTKSYVDQWGNTRVLPTRILKPTYRPASDSYVYGLTDDNGKLKQHYMHILVAETFNRSERFKNLPNEIWKPIPSANSYEVSNQGRIRLKHRTYNRDQMSYCDYKLLHPDDNGHGYRFIRTKRIREYVHRLVAEAFISNPNKLPQIDHLDGDKSNNRVTNLEWVSGLENVHRAISNGLTPTGSRNWNAQLTRLEARNIKREYLIGIPIKVIASHYSCSIQAAIAIGKGKSYAKETENISVVPDHQRKLLIIKYGLGKKGITRRGKLWRAVLTIDRVNYLDRSFSTKELASNAQKEAFKRYLLHNSTKCIRDYSEAK